MTSLQWINYGIHRFSDVLRAAWFTTVARARFRLWGVQVGPGLCVTGPIRLNVHPSAFCQIGKECKIHSSHRANAVGAGQAPVFSVARGARLVIGNGVGISHAVIVCNEAVTIEDQVFVGGGTFITDTDSHSLLARHRLDQNDAMVTTRPVRIGRRSFIGGYALLLKGTDIGEEAVIGAGAVVSGRVPPREIWAGNPARFLRRLNEESGDSTS
jgi:acetyltransferase-like isoleucine patch superfamily enzyme